MMPTIAQNKKIAEIKELAKPDIDEMRQASKNWQNNKTEQNKAKYHLACDKVDGWAKMIGHLFLT